MTYPITRYKISRWPLLLLVVLLLLSSAHAQDNRATRVELAALLDNNEITVHVAVPRGQTVESAIFDGDETAVTLQPEPVQLPTTRWVLLDSGEGMVNRSSVAQAALRRFLPNANDQTRTGLIIYAQSPTRYLPTDDNDDLDMLLEGYSARVGEPGCVADALQTLNDLDRPLDRSRRVLIIGGELSRQGRCEQEGYVNVGAPVDMVVVNQDVSDTYLDIAERSGGVVFTANNRTLETRMNDIRTLWSQPVFRATGSFSGTAPERGTLTVTLSNDSQVTFDVELTDYRTQDSGTTDDQPQVGVLGGATAVPTNTFPPPTATSVPQNTAVATLAATVATVGAEQPTRVALTDEPTAIPPTQVSQPSAADSTAAPPTERPTNTPAATAVAQAQNTSVPTAIADSASDPDESGPDDESESVQPPLTSPPAEENGIDPILLIGGGLLGLGLAGLGVFVAMMRGSRSDEHGTSSFTGSRTSGEQTMIDRQQTFIAPMGDEDDGQTEIDPSLTDNQNDGPRSPEMDMYAVPVDAEDDELDLTEMITGDDLLDDDDEKTEIVMADDLLVDPPLIGYLRVQGDDTQSYELRPPTVTLGRNDTNDIVIANKKLSRKHLRFEVSASGQVTAYVLTNNAIAHNDVLVQTGTDSQSEDPVQVRLDDGDTLTIAPGIVLEYERAQETE